MATESLNVPEEHLAVVIQVIRNGLKNTKRVPREVRSALHNWCKEEEAYLQSLDADE